MRVAIQTKSDGVITGYMSYAGADIPEGYAAIIDIEDGIIVGGPDIVQAYKFSNGAIVRRTAKEIRKDARKFRKQPPQTDRIYFPSADRFAKDVIQELSAGGRRTREIVLLVFCLALTIGVSAASLVSFVAQPSSILLWLLIGSFIASVAIASIYLSREYGRKIALFRVPTAIVYNPTSREVALPRIINLGTRLSGARYPMIIASRSLFRKLNKFDLLKQNPFLQSQITVFLLILSRMNEMNQFGAGRSLGPSIDIGPFSAAGMYKSLPFYVAPLEKICPSEKDQFLIQEAMPNLKSMILPLGMSLAITFLSPSKSCTIRFSNRDLEYSISVSMGTGGGLQHSQWARTFNSMPNQLVADGVVLDGSIKYGGLSNRISSAFSRKAKWSLYDYLNWVSDTMQWITDYISWLENDTDIPQSRAFVLTQEAPITYQALVNTGNPHFSGIVFDE
jgi:hypothetical protein